MITRPKPGFVPEFFGPPAKLIETSDMAYLDDEVLKGGRYTETVWFRKGSDEIAVYPHADDFDEILGFFASDSENPHELCGQIEEAVGGEKYVMTESCILFVPAGVVHGPLSIGRVDRPIFHFATGDAKVYRGEKR